MRNSSLVRLILIGAACAACTAGGLHLAGKALDWRYALLSGYFIIVSFFLLRWQEDAASQVNVFIRRFIAGLMIKLMGSVVLMVILVKTSPKEMTLPLVVVFIGFYVAFTSFSVARLMKIIQTPRTGP